MGPKNQIRLRLNRRLGRKLVTAFFLSLVAAVGAEVLVNSVGWIGHLELTFSPNRSIPASPNIVVIEQNASTPEKLGIQEVTSLVPRRFHAALINGLKAAGAKVVVFDYQFDEERVDAENTQVQDAIQNAAPLNVVLGFAPNADQPTQLDPEPSTTFKGNFCKPPVANENVYLGSLIPWNPDRIVHGFVVRYHDREVDVDYPHVAVSAALAYKHLAPDTLQLTPDHGAFVAGPFRWPIGADLEYRTRWTHKSHPFPTYEYSDALASLSKPTARERFGNKIVIVGSVADLTENIPTEVFHNLSGIQVIAQFINSLIAPTTSQTSSTSILTNFFWCWGLGLFVALLIGSLRWQGVLAGLLAGGGLAIWVPHYLLDVSSIRLETLAPIMTALIAGSACAAVAAIRAGRYDPSFDRVPGKRLDTAIMFVDLKGSTAAISDMSLDPASAMLHGVLETLVRSIRQNGGVIERMMGDGAMAFWVANPRRNRRKPDSHLLACLDTVATLESAVADLDRQMMEKYNRHAQLSVGIEAGEIVGQLVSESGHEEWSWFGLSIHLAARLQSFCGEAGVDLCIGPEAARRIGSRRPLRPVASAELKGIPGETQIYTVDRMNSNIQP